MSDLTPGILAELTPVVQHNCHISDALYARNYTLCIYLLKMREYYRWEKGYGYQESLPKEALGKWLVGREQLWEELEHKEFQPIELGGIRHDPFDAEALNRQLAHEGLVYSAGLGSFAKPHFFLAQLEKAEQRQGAQVLIAGREYARDLTAPPAMTREGTIYVRRESLRRLVWEKMEEWLWQKRDGPMKRLLAHYHFDDHFDEALDAVTEAEAENVILHELGEIAIGQRLGGRWEELLSVVLQSKAEHLMRAVRDHMADCQTTLPALIEREAAPSLHFYFANWHGLRREIFPALLKAYYRWVEGGDLQPLARAVSQGQRHWPDVACSLLEFYDRLSEEPAQLVWEIEKSVEAAYL